MTVESCEILASSEVCTPVVLSEARTVATAECAKLLALYADLGRSQSFGDATLRAKRGYIRNCTSEARIHIRNCNGQALIADIASVANTPSKSKGVPHDIPGMN